MDPTGGSPELPTLFSGHRGPVYALIASGTRHFLSGGSDGHVVRWAIDHPDAGEAQVNVGQAIFSLCAPNGHALLAGTEGGGLHVIDLAERRERHLFQVHRRGLFRMLILPGERLAAAGGDGTLSIWSVGGSVTPTLLRQFPLGEDKLRDLALSADGGHLAVACGDGLIRVLDARSFNELFTLEAHAEGTSSLAYHPTKPVLVSGGKDGHLRFWRRDTGYAPIMAFPAHRAAIYRIAFAPHGHQYATASRDKSVKTWNALDNSVTSRLERVQGGHTHSVNDLLWCGGLLLSASDDRTIRGQHTRG